MNRHLEDFEIIKVVGDGRSSRVCLAKDKKSGERVALKAVYGDQEKRVWLEKANAEAVMKLSHPNIVRVFGCFFEATELHVVMQYCSDRNLRNVLKAKEVEEVLVVRWAEELASVAVYLQQNGIIHNDIKPENLMVTAERSIVLVDFGEAQMLDRPDQPARTAGTDIYEAPERKNGGSASFASDMWSCGIVIYEINYLKKPVKSIQELVEQHEILLFKPSRLGDLFEPILEEILVVDARARMDAQKLHRILKDYIERQIFPPRKPRVGDVHRINESFPKLQSKHFINIVPPQDLDRLFFPPPADKKLEKRVVLLAGLPGSGKSTAAEQYGLHWSQASDSVVVFFHADDEAKIDDRVRTILVDDLAVSKETVSKMNREARVARIREHIKNSGRKHLFVFDNVDSLAQVAAAVELFVRWQPRDLRIVLTSRDHSIRLDGLELVRKPFLSAAQVKLITVERLESLLSNACVQRVCEKFMSLVELTEDASARERSRVTPYMLKSFMDAILARLDASDTTTRKLTLADLERVLEGIDVKNSAQIVQESVAKYPGCEKLLGTIAFLDPDAVSGRCLRLLADADCQESRKTLEKFAVLEAYFSENVAYVKLHRSTRKLIKRRMRVNRDASESKAARLTQKLASVLGDTSASDKERQVNFKHVYVHALKFIKRQCTSEERLQLIDEFLKCLSLYRNEEKTLKITLALKAFEYVEKKKYVSEPNHSDIGKRMCGLGLAYMDNGEYVRAREWFMRERAVYQDRAEAADSSTIADNLLHIAKVNYNLGKHQEAFESASMAVDMFKRLDLSSSASVALLFLARCCHEIGKLDEAATYSREALEMGKQQLSPTNDASSSAQDMLASIVAFNQLGLSNYKAGDLNESMKYLQKAYEMFRPFSKNHSLTHLKRALLNNLGLVYADKGDHATAVKYFLEALDLMKMMFKDNPNHPEFALALNNPGMAYLGSGDLAKALEYLSQAFQVCSIAFKDQPNHPTFAFVLTNLSIVYEKTNAHEKAIECGLAALEKLTSIHSSNSDIARQLNVLGASFLYKGDYEKSLKYLQEAREILEAKKDKRNQDELAFCLCGIGQVYDQIGNNQRALEYSLRAYETAKQAYDGDMNRQQGALVLNNLGALYLNSGNIINSTRYLSEAEAICKVVFKDQPNHALCLQVASNLSLANERSARYAKEIQELTEELEMKKAALKRSKRGLFGVLAPTMQLLLARFASSNDEESLNRLRKESKIAGDACGSDAPQLLCPTLFKLGQTCEEAGDYNMAIKYYSESLELTRQEKDPNYESLYLDCRNLGELYCKVNDGKRALECFLEAYENKKMACKDDANFNFQCAIFLMNLAKECRRLDVDHSIKFLLEACELLKETLQSDERSLSLLISFNFDLARSYYSKGDDSRALQHYKTTYELLRKEDENQFGSSSRKAKVLYSKGALPRRYDINDTIDYWSEASELISKEATKGQQDLSWFGNILFDFAYAFQVRCYYAKAIEYYKGAYELRKTAYKDDNDNHAALSSCNFGAGVCYLELGQFEPALEHLLAAYNSYQAENNKDGLEEIRSHLGVAYYKLSHFEKAIEHLLSHVETFRGKLSETSFEQPDYISYLGNACFEVSDYESAIRWLLEAVRVTQVVWSNMADQRIIRLYKNLAEAYHALGDEENAKKYYKMATETETLKKK